MQSLIDKFNNYHANNPGFYEKFEYFTLEAIKSGRKNFGAGAIFERMRWFTNIEKKEEFKCCNSYRAFYARMFEDNHPEHVGFFRKRKSIADYKEELF